MTFSSKDRLFLKKNPVKDMMGFGTYNQPVGSWSDDTSLTLCLLDSINFKDDTIDKELLSKNILNWYHYTKHILCCPFSFLNNRAIKKTLPPCEQRPP